jgi:hypothetical protein
VAVFTAWLRRAQWPAYGAAAIGIVMLGQSAAALDVPSHQRITLLEVLTDTVGTENWLRFRFVAPDITRDGDYELVANDMTHLCQTTALPYIAEYALTAEVIVISLSDRPTEFGQADPDAIQFFEAFRVQGDTCIWEGL